MSANERDARILTLELRAIAHAGLLDERITVLRNEIANVGPDRRWSVLSTLVEMLDALRLTCEREQSSEFGRFLEMIDPAVAHFYDVQNASMNRFVERVQAICEEVADQIAADL